MDYKAHVAEKLKIEGVSKEEIESFITTPPDTAYGDYALPCFRFSKILRRSPAVIAEELASSFETDEYISACVAVNGYLNFTVNRGNLTKSLLNEIISAGDKYGSSEEGNGKTIVIDYSSTGFLNLRDTTS